MFKKIIANHWTLGIMFSLGLLTAGSDGEWFPWVNVIGVCLIGFVALISNHLRPAPWRK